MTRALLRLASWIVPRDARADWLAEWRAELFHVERAAARPLAFCLGAFRDALWLRRHDPAPRASLLASPAHCLVVLAAIAALGVLLRPDSPIPDDVVALRPHGRDTLTPGQYRALLAHPPAQFAAIAFYRTSGHKVVANRAMRAVLRGAPLPDGRYYGIVDDPGPGNLYALARLSTVQRAPWRHVSIYTASGGREYLDCVPLAPGKPVGATLLIFALGVLVLPALTRFSVSGYALARGWAFLAAKLALTLTAAYCVMQAVGPHMRVQGFLIGFLFAILWTFRDQQRRCPVCLRRLASPVSFGCLSHTLLEWHGSEFICPQGHGLLQVSATPASPYAPQQWLRL